jgi:hypothetical protein
MFGHGPMYRPLRLKKDLFCAGLFDR